MKQWSWQVVSLAWNGQQQVKLHWSLHFASACTSCPWLLPLLLQKGLPPLCISWRPFCDVSATAQSHHALTHYVRIYMGDCGGGLAWTHMLMHIHMHNVHMHALTCITTKTPLSDWGTILIGCYVCILSSGLTPWLLGVHWLQGLTLLCRHL